MTKFNLTENHSFNIEVARLFGVDEAIVIGHFAHFLKYHEANETNFYEGHYWVYDSAKSLSDALPYWSSNKIQKLIKRMEDRGLLISGDFSEDRSKRPKYYRLGPKLTGEPDESEKPNGLEVKSQTADTCQPNGLQPISQMADSSLSDHSTDQSPDQSFNKKSNQKKGIPKKYSNLDFSPLGFTESQVIEFIQLRENKRAGITKRVISNIAQELGAARAGGFTNEQILDVWSERGWASFKFVWFKNATLGIGRSRDGESPRDNFDSNHDLLGGFKHVN